MVFTDPVNGKKIKGDQMLSTEKITHAFTAICEEAEKLLKGQPSGDVKEGLSQIISIAKHQSDIRNAAEGSCKTARTH
jgi:hypothetical protein